MDIQKAEILQLKIVFIIQQILNKIINFYNPIHPLSKFTMYKQQSKSKYIMYPKIISQDDDPNYTNYYLLLPNEQSTPQSSSALSTFV